MDAEPIGSGIDRRLAPSAQAVLLIVGGVVVLALLFGLPKLVQALTPKTQVMQPLITPGQFTATDQQWATLSFATVQTAGFSTRTDSDGKIAADDDRTTQVFSPYSGRVTRVFAKVGDVVQVGQPLFAIDASEFVQGQSDVVVAAGQVAVAKAAEERQHALYTTHGAALKDWQQSQFDLTTAQSALTAARNRLRILGFSDAEITTLEHGLPNKGFSPEAMVRAPIRGTVIARAIGEGQSVANVTNGATAAAFVVSDLSKVWLVGELREVDAPKARVGQSMDVQVLALPGRNFQAKVSYVSPTVDPVTRRVTVRAEIANPDGILKPEMFAVTSLQTGSVTSAVGLPETAVIFEGDTARVWVAHPRHRLELRQIHIGQTVDGTVEVLSGLQPGEQVVTGGALFIDRAAQVG